MTFFFFGIKNHPQKKDLRGISVGALSESKILKMSGHVRKTLKLVLGNLLLESSTVALLYGGDDGRGYSYSYRKMRAPGGWGGRNIT
jgi:hypothetical protein